MLSSPQRKPRLIPRRLQEAVLVEQQPRHPRRFTQHLLDPIVAERLVAKRLVAERLLSRRAIRSEIAPVFQLTAT